MAEINNIESSPLRSQVNEYIKRSKEIGRRLFDFSTNEFYESPARLIRIIPKILQSSPLFSSLKDINLEMHDLNDLPALHIPSPQDTHTTVIQCVSPEPDGGIPLALITQVGKDKTAVSIATSATKKRLHYNAITLETGKARYSEKDILLAPGQSWIKIANTGEILLEDSNPANVIKNIPSSFITSILKSIWSNTPITQDPLMQSLFQWTSLNSSY